MAKVKGKGTLLQVKISGTYTTVAQRTEVMMPQPKRNAIEATGLDDEAEDSFKGILRGGSLPLKCWYDPNDSTHEYLENSFYTDDNADELFQVVLQSSPTKTKQFTGWIEDWKPGTAKIDNLLELDLTIRITGAPTG
ncbi:MAG TPA: hypothetical protein VGG64_29885 [Pirellulales bacterium]|jgi:hypothetical protein